jgi:hypothetical protein
MAHLASSIGVKDDPKFEAAYWKVFRSFFGEQNSWMVRATLLTKYDKADTGATDLDRVCFGLRQTMGWAAEAIERRALSEIGRASETEKVAAPS